MDKKQRLLLWTRQWTFKFRGNSWLAEQLLAHLINDSAPLNLLSLISLAATELNRELLSVSDCILKTKVFHLNVRRPFKRMFNWYAGRFIANCVQQKYTKYTFIGPCWSTINVEKYCSVHLFRYFIHISQLQEPHILVAKLQVLRLIRVITNVGSLKLKICRRQKIGAETLV